MGEGAQRNQSGCEGRVQKPTKSTEVAAGGRAPALAAGVGLFLALTSSALCRTPSSPPGIFPKAGRGEVAPLEGCVGTPALRSPAPHPGPGGCAAVPSPGHEMAPVRRGSVAAAPGPPQPRLRRLLRGNNAAPPRVARRGQDAGHPRAGSQASGRAGARRPRREPWGLHGTGPGSGAAQRLGGLGRGPGAASSRHRGRGPGDEGARGGEPVCAPRRRPAQRASPSRQTRGRRSGGAPPPGPQNVKR